MVVDAALLLQRRRHVERNSGAHKLQELLEGGNEASSRTTTEVLPKMRASQAYGQGGLFVINEEGANVWMIENQYGDVSVLSFFPPVNIKSVHAIKKNPPVLI